MTQASHHKQALAYTTHLFFASVHSFTAATNFLSSNLQGVASTLKLLAWAGLCRFAGSGLMDSGTCGWIGESRSRGIEIANLNSLQRINFILGCLSILYVVFINLSKVLYGVNGVLVNASGYFKNGEQILDCKIAMPNDGLLTVYVLVISAITSVLNFVTANKGGTP